MYIGIIVKRSWVEKMGEVLDWEKAGTRPGAH